MTKPGSMAEGIRAGIGPRPAAPAPSKPAPARPAHVRRPKPARRADRAALLAFTAARTATFTPVRLPGSVAGDSMRDVGPADKLYESAFIPPVHGCAAIVAKFARVGVRLALTPAEDHIYAITERGLLPPELREALESLAPLLVAHLRGRPLGCAFCTAPAASLLVGGAPSCALHAAEVVEPPAPSLAGRVRSALGLS